jgi:hypothetical protein
MPSDSGTAQSGRNDLKTLTTELDGDLKYCVRQLKLATDPKAGGALAVLEHWSALHSGLGRLSGALPAVANVVSAVQRDADREFDEAESELRERCSARGWALSGQWPDFYVEYGIPVSFVKDTRAATVASRRVPGNATAVMSALEPIVGELIPPKFSDKAFLDAMSAAFDAATRGGGQTPVLSVYKNMVIDAQGPKFWRDARASAFRGMSVDQFRARLTRCLLSGRQQDSRGRSLRLFPALNPADAIFVFQPAEQRFGWVGRVEFIQD